VFFGIFRFSVTKSASAAKGGKDQTLTLMQSVTAKLKMHEGTGMSISKTCK
jgi:hypothetical protein